MGTNAGRRMERRTRAFLRYTVYDNRTGFPVIVSGTASECAKAMGVSISSFYNCVDRSRKGTNKRWSFVKELAVVENMEEESNGNRKDN